MVTKFVRDQFPKAKFQRIYDSATDGWGAIDFHRRCNKKGWTLTIVETTKNFIFGGFTTAEWVSSTFAKPCSQSFLFSVNEGRKYPNTLGGRDAIRCDFDQCATFGYGGNELEIDSESNDVGENFCNANGKTFKLPAAGKNGGPSMNGGEKKFLVKHFEVYTVSV